MLQVEFADQDFPVAEVMILIRHSLGWEEHNNDILAIGLILEH